MNTEYLKKYLEEFERKQNYRGKCNQWYLYPTLLARFEEYIQANNIELGDLYDYIVPFSEALPCSKRTQRNYRTRLRRYVEYIYKQENIRGGF